MNTKLKVSKVSKIYPGCIANDNVSLNFESGKIYALLGENGAGKSTLVKILSGVINTNEGQIFLNDKLLKLSSPKDAKNNNIGMVFQHFNLFETLSVFENLSIDSEKNNYQLRILVNNILKKYNFIRIYKSKMFFRKTFEYIYENSKLDWRNNLFIVILFMGR